jgi:hypothetical protein
LAVGKSLFTIRAQRVVPSLIITCTLIGFLKLAAAEEEKEEAVGTVMASLM